MRILIADDEKDIVELLKGTLIKRGYSLDTAFDGKEALNLIKINNYDLVFLDHNMPELTGLELVEFIKKNNIDTRVVIVTGYPHLDDTFVKHIGADEYLVKPVKLKDLLDIIDKYKK